MKSKDRSDFLLTVETFFLYSDHIYISRQPPKWYDGWSIFPYQDAPSWTYQYTLSRRPEEWPSSSCTSICGRSTCCHTGLPYTLQTGFSGSPSQFSGHTHLGVGTPSMSTTWHHDPRGFLHFTFLHRLAGKKEKEEKIEWDYCKTFTNCQSQSFLNHHTSERILEYLHYPYQWNPHPLAYM